MLFLLTFVPFLGFLGGSLFGRLLGKGLVYFTRLPAFCTFLLFFSFFNVILLVDTGILTALCDSIPSTNVPLEANLIVEEPKAPVDSSEQTLLKKAQEEFDRLDTSQKVVLVTYLIFASTILYLLSKHI